MGDVVAFPGTTLSAAKASKPLVKRAPARIRIFEDAFGDFGIEVPLPDQPGKYAYDHFPTLQAARDAARRIERKTLWRVFEDFPGDDGGRAA